MIKVEKVKKKKDSAKEETVCLANGLEVSKFENTQIKADFEKIISGMGKSIKPNSYGDSDYQGSCPNHPNLYKNISNFRISESENVIEFIDEIYKLSDIKYY